MASRVKRACDIGLVKPPDFVSGGLQYEVLTGSQAYGIATDKSDMDIYGFCVPPMRIVFPHLVGYIDGFGSRPQGFDQWMQHHVIDKEAGKEYDFTILSIIKYLHLTMAGNPNMIDTLFVPARCVIHSTKIGDMVRERRKLFLSKKVWHTFKGYAFQQMKKMRDKNPIGKRKEEVERTGMDCKFATHTIRLLLEVEQILETGDLDLERDREMLKGIRRGEWTVDQVCDYFNRREKDLQELYNKSELPYAPPEEEIKSLLINCLEEAYGNISQCVERPSDTRRLIDEIENVLRKFQ